MKDKTRFDYSQLNLFRKCPQAYNWTYVDKRFPKIPSSMHFALNGIAIQKLFELFYNNEWYYKRDKCREFMYEQAPKIFEDTLKYIYVNWEESHKTKQQLYEDFLEHIPKGLDVVKQYKLLGTYAKSEQKLQVFFEPDKYVIFIAKIDFIIKNHEGVQILDGKYTSSRNKYLKDTTQLDFYAMVYKLKYGKYPDKLGFWFWKDSDIAYVTIEDARIEKLKENITEVLYKIYKKEFEPNPVYESCMFCNFKNECEARTVCINNKKLEKNGRITQDDLKSFL